MDVDTSSPDPDSAGSPANSEGVARAEGLWFEDCGLIIQADNTLFRVSRDLLAYHSSVFRDMLSLPTPKDAEMMDGCPFVNLPDSAEDTTVFLKAMIYYDFFEPAPAPTTLSILSGVLRLSHKYEVDALRKRALLHISQFHPTTLQEWEQLGGKSIPWLDESIENGYLSIVILARQFSMTGSFLPRSIVSAKKRPNLPSSMGTSLNPS